MKSHVSLLTAVPFAFILACSSSSGGEAASLDGPAGDLTGSWTLSAKSTECGFGNMDLSIQITQSGNSLEIAVLEEGEDELTVTGSIVGNLLTLLIEEEDEEDFLSVHATATVDFTHFTFSGPITFSKNDNEQTCTGAGNIIGNRQSNLIWSDNKGTLRVLNDLTERSTVTTSAESQAINLFAVPSEKSESDAIVFGTVKSGAMLAVELTVGSWDLWMGKPGNRFKLPIAKGLRIKSGASLTVLMSLSSGAIQQQGAALR